MLFNVLPVLLMFVSLAVIVVIVGKRLPEIVALNIEEIAEAQTATKKRQLLVQGLEKRVKEVMGIAWNKTTATRQKVGESVTGAYEKLQQIERLHRFTSQDKPEKTVTNILAEAKLLAEQENWSEAEKLYLDALRYDERNREAYVGLGVAYKAMDQYEEAKESLLFAFKLDKQDTFTLLHLAEVFTELGDKEKAISTYATLVEIEPQVMEHKIALGDLFIASGQPEEALKVFSVAVEAEASNPRALDRLIEAAIICGDKKLAQSTLRRLKKVNKENNKIGDFEARIKDLA